MEKKYLAKIVFVFAALLCINFTAFSQCKAKQIAKGCKDNIKKPYKYDSFAVNELLFDTKSKEIEVQFTAFQGQRYKIVFCSSGFDEKVTMNVFDKSRRIKNNRHKLYDSTQGIDSDFWSFEPPKSGNYFIVYSIPPSVDGKPKTGCIVMLIAYTEPDSE
ncbi:MAG: hypothetical protein A3F72_08485 [Bacteroidetes bacterium RIFCSPLOWO2_12_FULL_35_15]|nr:MAG: hypothetical protein A3F72_08485 [Bacteroidetes bacterium RIFCSPLOWO2_12_FULL_35_15]